MAEKRMLIVDAEVVSKIDANRGDMNQSEFIKFLIDSNLESNAEEVTSNGNYVTQENFQQLEQGIKDLLRTFLEFFLSYGLELGKRPEDEAFNELSKKLQSLKVSDNQSNDH